MKINHKMQGHTLIEMMIALTIGLIIMGLCAAAFITIKRFWMMQQGDARIQENARIVHALLHNVVQMDRSFGCEKYDAMMSFNVAHDINLKKYELEDIKHNIKNDKNRKNNKIKKDSLHLQFVNDPQSLKNPINANADRLDLNNAINVANKDVLVIADCHQAHLFRYKGSHSQNKGSQSVKTIKGSPNQFSAFKHTSLKAITIGKLTSIIYEVKKTNRVNSIGEPIFALYETDLNGRQLERVEGVEALEVEMLSDKISIKILLSSIEPVFQGKSKREWWHFVFEKQ